MLMNPIPTQHAKKRVHQRFGIPLSQSHSWIARKLQQANFSHYERDAQIYYNGGVRFVVKGRLVVSVTQ